MKTIKFQCLGCKSTAFFKAAARWIQKIEIGEGVELKCPVCGSGLRILLRNKPINIK